MCFQRVCACVCVCGLAAVNWLTLWLCWMSHALTLVYHLQSAQHGLITRGASRNPKHESVSDLKAPNYYERCPSGKKEQLKTAVAPPTTPLSWDGKKADGEWLKKRQNKGEKNSRIMGLSAGWVVRIHLHGVTQGAAKVWFGLEIRDKHGSMDADLSNTNHHHHRQNIYSVSTKQFHNKYTEFYILNEKVLGWRLYLFFGHFHKSNRCTHDVEYY